MDSFEATLDADRLPAISLVTRRLQRLIDQGFLEAAPGALAWELVTHAWALRPALFDGREGPRPHPLAVAAIALAEAVRLESFRGDAPLQAIYVLALSTLLDGIAREGELLRLQEVDRHLLDAARAVRLGHLHGDRLDPLRKPS
ncbi:hypothetical protein [Dyella japonica]|uniref:Uncharacterized protein n=1 Tax=Dyella japonica TaxID=231455 RepID=A0ABV2JQ76_9GAMM